MESIFDRISKIPEKSIALVQWDDFINKNKIADETLKKFLSDANQTDKSLEAFKLYPDVVNKTGKAFNFAALGAKAFNMAMNAAIMFAVVKGIELAAKAIDNYIHRLDNAKEALASTESDLSSVKSEIETTTDRIKELEAMDSLSITDKEDLQRLKDQNEELRIRQQYLEKQKQSDADKVADLTKEKYNSKYGNTTQEDINKYRALYGNNNKNTYTSVDEYGVPITTSYYSGNQTDEYGVSTGLSTESKDLANLIAQYQYYQEEKAKAIAANDETSIEKYNAKLKDTNQKLMDNRKTLQGFSDDLAGEASPELDGISEKLKLIDDLLLTPGQNLTNFINSNILNEDKDKLVALADSGELTAQVLSTNFADVDAYLKENKLTLGDLISVIRTYKDELSKAEEVAKKSFIPEFENLPIDKIEEYISLVKSGNIDEGTITSFSELKKLMSDTGMSAKDAAKALKDYADGYTLSTDLISNMQGAYDLLKNVGDQYKKTGLIGLSSLESIVKQYPQLRTAVNEYVQGLISADDVMGQLHAAYDNDTAAFRSAMAYKLSGNEDFFSTIVNNNQSLFDDLGKAYGLDVTNWKNMAQAKAEIDQKLIQSLSTAWSKYYNIVFDSVSGLASLDGMDLSRVGSHGTAVSEEQQKAWSEATKQANKYNQIINKLNEAASIQVEPPDFRGIGSVDKAGSDKKKKDETQNDIDWIARNTKVVQDEYAKLEDLANKDTIAYLGLTQGEFDKAKSIFDNGLSNSAEGLSQLQSYADKAGLSLGELYTMIQSGAPSASKENALQSMLKMQTETLLPQYQREVEAYSKAYEDALKEIPSEYRDKVENGGEGIESLPSDLAKKVQAAIDANERLKSSEKQLADGENKHIATIKELHENRIDAIDIENEKLQQSNKIIKSQIELMEARGKIVDADFYKRQINNNKGLISGNQQNIAEWESEMADLRAAKVDTNSKEYKELQARVKAAKNEIYGLKLEQEEFNQKLKQMPIDHLSTMISMYGDITAKIENWGTVHTATGGKLNTEYYQMLISNGATVIGQYEKQIREIKNLMRESQKGSTVWKELYSQLQDIDSATTSMLSNLQKWNEELLKMPLDSINTYSDSLQKVITGLNGVKSELDSATSAITTAISDQIDLLEEEQKAAADARQAEIDALQEKADLLEKTNEKLKLQMSLEQAEYNLARSLSQKVNKEVRNGEEVFVEDYDAVRKAKEDKIDAQFNIDKYNLEQQIEDAKTALDDLNDSYQDQIDALEKVSQKYSEISSAAEKISNANLATSLFGEGWAEKLLSGNDNEIYATLTSLYQTNAKQLEEYQKQADSTSSIQTLIEDYVNSFKAGEITYEQAMTKINGLLSQMSESMTAMDKLQNIYDYLGTVNGVGADADSILKGIKDGLAVTADELTKSLEQYNKNSGMISEHTSSWEQLTNNVSSMLDVLKQVRDNLRNALDNYDRDDDDDNDNTRYGGGKDGSPGTPGRGDYVNSGPGVKLATSRKDGITRGLVGSSSDSDKEASMKLLGLKKLDPDELPAVLHMGEAVFNQDQQNKLLENFRSAYSFQPTVPDYSKTLANVNMSSRSEPIVVNLKYGDLSFPNVRNGEEVVGEFVKLSEQALRQSISKFKR